MPAVEQAQTASEVARSAEEMLIIQNQVQDFISMCLKQLECDERRLLDTTLRAAKRYLEDAEQINRTLIFYKGE